MVKSGQPLYLIDPAPYQAQYDSAKASLARAEANAKSAESTAERSQALLDINAISKQGAEEAIATRDAAKADVARSEEHKTEIQSLMCILYDVFCLKKKNRTNVKYD